MKIKAILSEFSELSLVSGNPDLEINYIQADSRRIEKGDIFVLTEENPDLQKKYLDDANTRGALALLTNQKLNEDFGNAIPLVLKSENSIGDLHGRIASFLLGNPSNKLKIIGITGTNGKTSVTQILAHIAKSFGKKVGIIGTIHIKINEEVIESEYTTPDASSLQKILHKMLDENVEYVFMEMSSHGLKLGRVAGVQVDAIGFTNITQDHLDFHKTMEDYLESKCRIFQLLEESRKEKKFGMILSDAPGSNLVLEKVKKMNLTSRVVLCGTTGEYQISSPMLSLTGSSFRLHRKFIGMPLQEVRKANTNLLGGFATQNVGLASFIAFELGFSWVGILDAIQKIPTIRGRFDVVPFPETGSIGLVDYAHTPDAVENILNSCLEIKPHQLVCILGCGGDRDRTKRPIMASIAEKLADYIIITSDNPRTESPAKILSEMEKGFSASFTRYEKIENRREAIERGVALLEKGGILAVLGKGHEDYQIIGKEKTHFDDKEELMRAFENLKNRRKQ